MMLAILVPIYFIVSNALIRLLETGRTCSRFLLACV